MPIHCQTRAVAAGTNGAATSAPTISGLLSANSVPLSVSMAFPAEMTLVRIPAGNSHILHAFVRDLSPQRLAEEERVRA